MTKDGGSARGDRRRYTLRARATGVAETRGRVVAAARDLVVEGDVRRVTMDEVARRAQVGRATVYHQFGSKLGLVEALVGDLEGRAGLDDLAAIVEGAEPADLVEAVVVDGCRYWGTDPALARKIIGLGILQDDVGELLARHDAGRLGLLTRLVERLDGAGLLAEGCPPPAAVDALWVLTSFDAYDLLTRGRGLPHDEAASALVTMAQDRLCAGS